MSNFTIYNSDSTEIRYECDNQQNLLRILKFCSFKNFLFILNSKFELFYGTVEKNYVKFKLFKPNIIDIELHDEQFFIIDENGCVHKTPVADIESGGSGQWKEIVVPNPKTCPHGFKSITEKVRISRINCNSDGILFTSFNNELYGMGNFSEVLQSDYPIKVECFSGLKILQVTTGDNFAVILTSKRTDPTDFDYENSSIYDDIKDTFISTECPKCPISKAQPNKNVSKSTTETSMASSSSGTFDSEENQKNIEALNKAATPIKSNKDLAINFFLESLSILSEDFIEGGKQTKLVKDNVSNITSMVYEGVKTLSRHMSGSDNNDTPPMESFEIVDDNSSLKNEFSTFGGNSVGMSLSETSSLDNDEFDIHSEVGLEKNINELCRIGNTLLTTGVWSFGSVNREGQLGTGDQVKRNIIIPVLKLQGQGVIKVSSGPNHSVALTLDGRLYLWGSNISKQISSEQYEQYSSPKLYKNKEKILDIICSDYSTIILLNNLNIIEENNKPNIRDQSISSSSFEIVKNSDLYNNSCNIVNFLCSKQYLLINHNLFKPIINYLTIEQKYLYDLLTTYNTIIKPFIKKIQFITPQNGQLYDNLINLYLNIIYLTIINCKTIKEYYLMHITCTQILFIKNLNELVKLYRNYLKKFTNLLCINGYDNLKLQFDKKLSNTNSHNHSNSTNLNIKKIFEFPLMHIVNYKNFLNDIKKYEFELDNFLSDKHKYYEKFLNEIDQVIGDSIKTLNFWKTADKLLIANDLYEPERRLILDSKDVSLKLNGPTMSLLSQRFILFTDYLCYLTSNQLYKYQLTTLWVETMQKFNNSSSNNNNSNTTSNNSNDSKQRNLLKIITPENHIIVVTKSHEDKIRWLEELSKWIKISLKKSIQSKVPINRNTSYQFSEKHQIYGGVKYFGMWSNGLMHGIGRLEFLDGKVYNGLMKNSEIHGFGQMFTPNLGTYEGNFENGKYHGYGVLEMKNKERYKGNFKNGEFSGHGKLENDRFNYFGEFLKNMKHGYGVLDDKFTGSKYLGMFENNKKHGFGTLFTLEGDYFNGIFVDDNLIGDGLALLADGSFYRGELNLNGPNGKGILYLSSPKNDSLNIDDYKTLSIRGRMMNGAFSGTWRNIKIAHGNLSTDIVDTEDIDIYNINPNKKWCSLFRDWEGEVFNDSIQSYNSNSIWNKISVYISNSKRKEKLKSDGFEMKNQLLTNKSTPVPPRKWNNSNYDSVSLVSNLSMRSSSNTQYSKRSTLDIKEKLPDIINHKSISSEMLMMMVRDDATTADDNKKLFELENAHSRIKTKRIYHSNDSIVHPESLLSSSETRRKTKESILEISPNFGIKELTRHDIMLIKEYLNEAFKDLNHPLGVLITKISKCFYFSYGHWNNKKPTILTRQALDELESISIRIYQIVRRLFPALPEDSMMIDENEKISHRYFYPILLSNSIYSSLFVLYASKCSPLDEICQRRIRFTDKKSDEELMKFIKIDSHLHPIIKNHYFNEAIQNFRQVETKFCPKEMLEQIKMTYELINRACYDTFGETFILNTDILIPLTIFLILRSNIPHIGAELLLLEDLLESEYELNGESGACFTHIKASYGYIISSNFFED